MSDHMTLMGADDVRRGGNLMCQAAEQIRSSVGYLDEILTRHQRWADDWLMRFEAAVDKLAEKA